MNKYEFIVDNSTTLSKFLFLKGLKASQIARLYKDKDVKIDNIRCHGDQNVLKGQKVAFFMVDNLSEIDIEKKKRYEIIFEDDNIIIVNKYAGIEVVGNDGLEGKINGAIAVHRLDKDTKGLLVMAKDEDSAKILLDIFKDRGVTKKYICEVKGNTNFDGRVLEAFLEKNSESAIVKVFKDNKGGKCKEIKTKFLTVKHGISTSLVDCELLTGRTHQIRAHLAYLGHPILGDDKYGDREFNKKHKEKVQKLFCYQIVFDKVYGKLDYLRGRKFEILPSWWNRQGNKSVEE